MSIYLRRIVAALIPRVDVHQWGLILALEIYLEAAVERVEKTVERMTHMSSVVAAVVVVSEIGKIPQEVAYSYWHYSQVQEGNDLQVGALLTKAHSQQW